MEAVAERIALGAPERGQPAQPVRRRDQHDVAERHRHRNQPEDVLVAQPGGHHHHPDHDRHGGRGPEVGLEQDERGQRAGDQRNRRERVGDVVDPGHPPVEGDGGEQHRRHLGQLRRLHAEPADAEPPPRPVDRPGEEHGDQQAADHRQGHPDHLVVLVGAVVDPHHDRQHGQPEHRPQHLAGDEVIGLLVAVERHHGRGAVDHHDADADQRQGRQEQPLVRLKLPRHTLPPSGRPTREGPPKVPGAMYRNTLRTPERASGRSAT